MELTKQITIKITPQIETMLRNASFILSIPEDDVVRWILEYALGRDRKRQGWAMSCLAQSSDDDATLKREKYERLGRWSRESMDSLMEGDKG